MGWTRSSADTVTVFASAIVSFLVIFVVAVYRVTNEIIIARRCIAWARVAIFVTIVCYCIDINIESSSPQRILLPSLGVIRPIMGLVFAFLAFFVSSHPIFRWIVVLVQPLYVASDIYFAATLRVQIDCRDAGTCLTDAGFSTKQLKVYEVSQYVACFFQLWLVLVTSYLLIAMGACRSRYPVRLFSMWKPLSQLPPRQAGSTKPPVPSAAPEDVALSDQPAHLTSPFGDASAAAAGLTYHAGGGSSTGLDGAGGAGDDRDGLLGNRGRGNDYNEHKMQ